MLDFSLKINTTNIFATYQVPEPEHLGLRRGNLGLR